MALKPGAMTPVKEVMTPTLRVSVLVVAAAVVSLLGAAVVSLLGAAVVSVLGAAVVAGPAVVVVALSPPHATAKTATTISTTRMPATRNRFFIGHSLPFPIRLSVLPPASSVA